MLPIVTVLANMVHFFLGLPILAAFVLYYQRPVDPLELLWFPVISSIAAMLVAATFLVPSFLTGLFDGGAGPVSIVVGFLFYLCQYFVIFFFNTALVGAAMIRLEGGDPTVADGLRIARSKLGVILGYAAIAATVGLLLKAASERAGAFGKILIGLLGMAWTVGTFLVVPILVTRDVGPIDAVKESMTLLKRTWGENVAGNVGIGLAFGIITALVVALAVALVIATAMTLGGTAALRLGHLHRVADDLRHRRLVVGEPVIIVTTGNKTRVTRAPGGRGG